MQSEALGCGSQAGYRGQRDWRPGWKQPTDGPQLSVGPFTHRPEQHRDCLGPAIGQKGDFLQHLLQHQQLCCSFFFFSSSSSSTDYYKINRTHIVLTFDLPPPLNKTKEGNNVFNLHF